jgi:hypothetical protein
VLFSNDEIVTAILLNIFKSTRQQPRMIKFCNLDGHILHLTAPTSLYPTRNNKINFSSMTVLDRQQKPSWQALTLHLLLKGVLSSVPTSTLPSIQIKFGY